MGDMSVNKLLGGSNSVRIRRCALILLDSGAALHSHRAGGGAALRRRHQPGHAHEARPAHTAFDRDLHTGADGRRRVPHDVALRRRARTVPADVFVRGRHGRGADYEPRVRLEDAALAVFPHRHFSSFCWWARPRFGWKICREAYYARRSDPEHNRVLIVGAGEGGAYAARACQEGRHLSGAPVAFVDGQSRKARPARVRHPRARRGGGHPRPGREKGHLRDHHRHPPHQGKPPQRDRLRVAKPPSAACAYSPTPAASRSGPWTGGRPSARSTPRTSSPATK